MTLNSLKPLDDGRYLSAEEAKRMLEKMPVVEPDAKGPEAEKQEAEPAGLEGRIIRIDAEAADNCNIKTQDEWIKYFNQQGSIMIAMPDLYMAGKSGNAALLNSLRNDFKKNWLVSSTRTFYNADDLNAKIAHYQGINAAKPVEHSLVVPVYTGALLDEVLNSGEGLIYLQALFGTTDNADEIRRTLKNLSNYTSANTKIWTPSQEDRKSWPERAAGLTSLTDEFHVSGYNALYSIGRSRRVSQ